VAFIHHDQIKEAGRKLLVELLTLLRPGERLIEPQIDLIGGVNAALLIQRQRDLFRSEQIADATSYLISDFQQNASDLNALKADLILPGSAYTEKDCIFINTEGRAQKTQKIVRSPGKSKNDASILSALINFISKQKIVVNLKLLEIEHYNVVFNAFFTDRQTRVNGVFKNSVIISSKLNNFYLSDSISKASPTMAKC
jgi:NADH dehydrogenase/NADH:ubiquinone oxidoreductase subunit G